MPIIVNRHIDPGEVVSATRAGILLDNLQTDSSAIGDVNLSEASIVTEHGSVSNRGTLTSFNGPFTERLYKHDAHSIGAPLTVTATSAAGADDVTVDVAISETLGTGDVLRVEFMCRATQLAGLTGAAVDGVTDHYYFALEVIGTDDGGAVSGHILGEFAYSCTVCGPDYSSATDHALLAAEVDDVLDEMPVALSLVYIHDGQGREGIMGTGDLALTNVAIQVYKEHAGLVVKIEEAHMLTWVIRP